MSITVTKTRGVDTTPMGDCAVFRLLLDDSFLGTGEAIDLTSYFSLIYAVTVDSVDAIADCGYKFQVVIPTQGTAVSASNVLVSAHRTPAATGGVESAQALENCNGANLSAVGELTITVVGKKAAVSSWA